MGAEGRITWPLDAKKSKNFWRISAEVMGINAELGQFLGQTVIFACIPLKGTQKYIISSSLAGRKTAQHRIV
jgi:hypothetical protein